MGIATLKERLRDVPGIHTLTMVLEAGQQKFNLAGRDIIFGTGDSEATIEAGIRAAIASPALAQMAAGGTVTPEDVQAAAVALHPTVAAQVQGTAPVSTSPSSPATHALTIKDALAQHAQKMDQILQAQVALLQSTLDEQITTVQGGTEAVISKVKSHTDDFKSILGQFTNMLGEL